MNVHIYVSESELKAKNFEQFFFFFFLMHGSTYE